MPPLTHQVTFSEQGVKGVFSKEAFNTSWTQYQRLLVDNLNRLIGGPQRPRPLPLHIAC